jgi:hypothetical protein
LTEDNADVRINGIPDDRNDTGLYELYKNVVERFNNKLIEEGDRYRTSIGSGANTSWKPRTYNAADPAKGDPEQTEGESYCFGCKNTYQDFWNDVTSCAPPKIGEVTSGYAGNVNNDGCGLTGMKKYTGHKDTEQKNNAAQYNAFFYWTGIDCAGFVQRITMAAKSQSIPGVNCKIPDLKDTDANSNRLDDGGVLAMQYFTDTNMTVFWENPADVEGKVKLQKKLHKGDLVRYGNTHVSTIYSNRPVCNSNSCTYEIVHAYGGNCTAYERDGSCSPGAFSRKVLVTNNIFRGFPNPTGFGRIKLWD